MEETLDPEKGAAISPGGSVGEPSESRSQASTAGELDICMNSSRSLSPSIFFARGDILPVRNVMSSKE